VGHQPDLELARRDARSTANAIAELRKIAPESGAYLTEASYFQKDWQRAFWGPNYQRLRAIKAKYDPHGLFFIHHGVGSEDWSADGWRRVS
jgi:FAD/FMN-containing dehydrogenase